MLLDLTHTSHTRSLTGIQRVARGLARELGARATPICHDPHARLWRLLTDAERSLLTAAPAAGRRRAVWPLGSRLRALLRPRRASIEVRVPADPEGLLVPEIFSPETARALPELLRAVPGPRVALFFDAVALKLPELTPSGTVARYPAYLRELLAFDGICAISEDARDTLRDYWRWLGAAGAPPVVAVPLGIDPPPSSAGLAQAAGKPVVLSVGTIEGRKNHLALLEACEVLWAWGESFELHLVGALRRETADAAWARIHGLVAAGRPLRHDPAASDAVLEAAYARASFTVYPSLMEGFGIPVAESLARGKPCVCSGRGALGELARGGGCVAVDPVDPAGLVAAIRRLLTSPAELARLSAEARARPVRTAADHARDVSAWMATLPKTKAET
jgi:glycosyltransferase involved in cell wall biosynthesis